MDPLLILKTCDMTYSRLAWTFCIVCRTRPMFSGGWNISWTPIYFFIIDPVLSRLITYIRLRYPTEGPVMKNNTCLNKNLAILLENTVLFTRPTIYCHRTVGGDYNDGPKTFIPTTTALPAVIPTLNHTIYCRTLYLTPSDRSRCSNLFLHYFILC